MYASRYASTHVILLWSGRVWSVWSRAGSPPAAAPLPGGFKAVCDKTVTVIKAAESAILVTVTGFGG